MPTVAERLKEIYGERRSRNPSYTLRAFARDLGLSSGRLTKILSEKEGISGEGAEKVARRLGLSPNEVEDLRWAAEARWARSRAAREAAQKKLSDARGSRDERRELDADTFKLVSDWSHLAILELLRVKHCEPAELAKRLGLSVIEVEMALARMLRLQLVKKVRESYRAVQDVFVDSKGAPSAAVLAFHEQILMKARQALFEQTPGRRETSSSILAMDERDLDEFKRLIKDFREKMGKRSKQALRTNAVYALQVNFFRLDEEN